MVDAVRGPMAALMQQIAGVDGCRDGWVVVRRETGGGTPHVEVFDELRNVFADPGLRVIAKRIEWSG